LGAVSGLLSVIFIFSTSNIRGKFNENSRFCRSRSEI
jgi:hypothetical protein